MSIEFDWTEDYYKAHQGAIEFSNQIQGRFEPVEPVEPIQENTHQYNPNEETFEFSDMPIACSGSYDSGAIGYWVNSDWCDKVDPWRTTNTGPK